VTRIAVVEVKDAPPDTAANVRACLASLAAAADTGAALALFPELFLGGYYLDHAMATRVAEAGAGLARIQAAVDETGVAAVLGAALAGGRGAIGALRDVSGKTPDRGARMAGDILLNACAILRPRTPPDFALKAHLYPGEEQWFTPGDRLWTGSIAGLSCGVAVCCEIGFPEVSRCLALQGALLILLPAAFGRSRWRVWDTLTRARAIENGCYVAAAGQSGTAGGRAFLGSSRIVDPFGEIVAGLDGGDGSCERPLQIGSHTLLTADIDEERVAAARRGDDGWHRSLRDRRPGLYGPLVERMPPAET
jgi:predicted amidohydrolase